MTDDICGSTNTSSGDPCKWNVAEKGECPFHNTDNPPDNGRESKLSYERQEKIAGAIEQGKSITSAARMAGISRNAVYDWLERGETDKQEGKDNEYVDFYDRVTRAKGHGEDKYFKTVWEMAKEEGDHRFLASLMKQRYPDSWGDTDTGVDQDKTVINIPDSVAERWERDITK